MTEKKNAFQRAFDAVIESRMRRAAHEVAIYHEMFDTDMPRKGR